MSEKDPQQPEVGPVQQPAPSETSPLAPAPAPPHPADILVADRPPPRPRPVLGSSLSVFGVLLWSYVVFGQFTTTWFPKTAPMSEGLAVFCVFTCTVAGWILAVRRSLVVPVRSQQALYGRAINIGVLGAGWWLLTVILAAILGMASGKNVDILMMPVLLVVSVVAIVRGRRIAVPERLPLSQRERTLLTLLWTGGVAVTLGACVELAGTS